MAKAKQADRPFEHEERLKELLARQSELNSALDLGKGDQQAAALFPDKDDAEIERAEPASPGGSRDELAKVAASYMRQSGTAIRELPVSERRTPQTGQVTAAYRLAIDALSAAFNGSPAEFWSALKAIDLHILKHHCQPS